MLRSCQSADESALQEFIMHLCSAPSADRNEIASFLESSGTEHTARIASHIPLGAAERRGTPHCTVDLHPHAVDRPAVS